MRWYADNSELYGIKETQIPDTHLFGGFTIEIEEENNLRHKIEQIKHSLCGNHIAPIKWNMKDLKKYYEQWDSLDIYDHIFSNIDEFRYKILEEFLKYDTCIIISIIEGYSSKKEILTEKREDLIRYVFVMGLQRFSLHVRDLSPAKADVVLDWPEGNDPRPYNDEYLFAYLQAKSSCGQKFFSPTLRELNFSDSILYSRTINNVLLQLSDIILGATKEFIQYSIGKLDKCRSLDLLQCIRSKYRGYPDNIFGRGICLKGTSTEIRGKIKANIQKYLAV